MAAPFADMLSKATGACITILCGAPPAPGTSKFYAKAVHAGKSVPTPSTPACSWSEFDPAGFGQAVQAFTKYVSKCDRTYTPFVFGSDSALT